MFLTLELTSKCNYRCPFCFINTKDARENQLQQTIRFKDIKSDLEWLIDRGLLYCTITGGEPLVQYKDVIEIFKHVREIGLKTKLDTSGVYPERLREILDLGLVDYVAMDIKAPFDKYKEVINADIGQKVKESMEIVNEYEDITLECRTTYCPKLLTEEDLFTIVEEVECDLYTIQQFRNRCVLDESLAEAEEPNPHDMEDITKRIKEAHPNQDINVKTAEFGQKSI